MRAAIAAGADGIATTSPDPGSLVEVATEANAAGIPIINFNTPDPTASFDAYVGGDNVVFGAQLGAVPGRRGAGRIGRLRLDAGRGARRHLRRAGGGGDQARSSSRSAITWEVTDATLDQAEIITRMSDYLTANRDEIDAIIGLGDLVTGSIKRVFDQVGVAAGDIPVVGWGNSLDTTQEVLTGYVNAAQWQDPQATSYVALSLAAMAAGGIPPGFDVITGALYEKDEAQLYDDILSGK